MSNTIVASPLVAADSAPQPTDLWTLSRLLLADWSAGVKLGSTWPVAISLARDTGEQRRCSAERPTRALSATLVGLRAVETWQLLNLIRRQAVARSLLPLVCDVAITTAPVYFNYTAGTGGNSISGELLASSTVFFNVNGQTGIPFTGSSSGIVVLTSASDAITVSVVPPTYDLTDPLHPVLISVGTVTYTLPAHYFIFRNTGGDLSTTAPSDRIVTDGTHTFTIPGSTDGTPSGVGLNVVDMGSHGFATQPYTTAVSVATINGFGWPDANGDVRGKFWLIPSGSSSANISLPAPAAVFCPTADRRFYVGGRIVIATESSRDDQAALNWFDIGTIASVGDGFMTLTTGLSRRYPTGSRVYPLLETHLILQQTLRGMGDEYATLQLSAKEVEGPSALPALADDQGTTDFGAFEGMPVFDLGSDEDGGGADYAQDVEHGFLRDGTAGSSGMVSLFQLGEARPRNTFGHIAVALSRARAFQILRLFDACRGPLRPFVAVSPLALFDLIDIPDSTSVRVRQSGPLSDYNGFPCLAVVGLGTGPNRTQVRRIERVSRAFGIDTIHLTAALTDTDASHVLRVTVAAPCRFNGSTINEAWQTDEVVSLAIPALEVFDKDVTINCVEGCDQPPTPESLCYVPWFITYDCETEAFGTAVAGTPVCLNTAPAMGWVKIGQEGTVCTYRKLIASTTSCIENADCSAVTTGPPGDTPDVSDCLCAACNDAFLSTLPHTLTANISGYITSDYYISGILVPCGTEGNAVFNGSHTLTYTTSVPTFGTPGWTKEWTAPDPRGGDDLQYLVFVRCSSPTDWQMGAMIHARSDVRLEKSGVASPIGTYGGAGHPSTSTDLCYPDADTTITWSIS